jgi:tRNA(Ile)-lysidine synthase
VSLSVVASRLVEFTNRYPSLKDSTAWALAVSGGADSTALVHAARELGREILLLHVNYRLRGAESDADESFVRQLGPPCEVFHPAVENSSEEHLRSLRYRYFAQSKLPVLTAHTRDDQAETVLHRLLRGTGPDGLAGIQPNLNERIFRPLLDLTRHELRAYLTERNLPWREDSSNTNLAYRRNYIRQVLLPQIEEHLNPEATAALARLALLAREDEQWLAAMAADFLPHFASAQGPARILNAKHFAEAPVALARRLLRALFTQFQLSEEIGFAHIEAALDLCRGPAGSGRLQLPGIDLLRSFDEIRVMRQQDLPGADRNFRQPLPIPGTVDLPGASGQLVTTLDKITPYNEEVQGLDWAILQRALAPGETLELRNWRPGDEYRRAGRDRPDKLKELFQKFRIPLWQRRGWPIVVLRDAPIWARDFGPSAEFAATSGSLAVLRIEFSPHPSYRS